VRNGFFYSLVRGRELIAERVSPNIERSVGFLALGSWLALAAILGEVVFSGDFALYHLLLFGSSILGIAGSVMWAASRPKWRALLLVAALSYLVVFVLRFSVGAVMWQLDYGSLVEAIRYAFWGRWLMLVQQYSVGLLEGLALTFYEWLMPVLQLIIVIALWRPLTARLTRTRAEVPRAG
jgi:hypothetical protein